MKRTALRRHMSSDAKRRVRLSRYRPLTAAQRDVGRDRPPRRCGKRFYATRDAAVVALAKSALSKHERVARRVYECTHCGGWHLTSLKAWSPGPTEKVRDLVLTRDEYRCVRCGRSIRGRDYNLQHRRARGAGGSTRPGTNLPANLITLCGTPTTGCHGHVESHRTEAGEMGWSVGRNAKHGEPTERPVFVKWRGWVLLDNDGGLRAAETGSAA